MERDFDIKQSKTGCIAQYPGRDFKIECNKDGDPEENFVEGITITGEIPDISIKI